MKDLLFTLLLLFVTIYPFFAAPAFAQRGSGRIYANRQKIIYTIITDQGTSNIECLWDFNERRLVLGPFRNTELSLPPGEFSTRVRISRREVDRYTFDTNTPSAARISISADIEFFARFHRSPAYRNGALDPGVTAIDTSTVTLRRLGFRRQPNANRGWTNVVANAYPQAIRFVFMTVMPPSSPGLDQQTENTILEQGIGAFLQQGVGSSSRRPPQPPLQLSPRIWIHLLTDTMGEYQPGDIVCETALAPGSPNPRPNPNDPCRSGASCSRPRDPDDQNDPGAGRETKRTRLDNDGNTFPGSNKAGDQQETGRIVYDNPRAHNEFQEPYSLWSLFGYRENYYQVSYRWEDQAIPAELTGEDNTGSSKRPRRMFCREVLKSSTFRP
jgi:hypothetical protein